MCTTDTPKCFYSTTIWHCHYALELSNIKPPQGLRQALTDSAQVILSLSKYVYWLLNNEIREICRTP